MLKIYPKINTYKSYTYSNNNDSSKTSTGFESKGSGKSDIAFGKFLPSSAKNRYYINKIVNFLKAYDGKLAILNHDAPDEDAVGAAFALKYMLESIGKKADIFSAYPLQESFRFIDPNNDIKVINPSSDLRATADEIKAKYGSYGAVICLDTSRTKLFNEELYEAFMKPAKYKIKIDHHPSENTPEYNYANINFVDSSQESASQIVMQFAKAFGLNIKNVSQKITDAITLGIMGDSGNLRFAKGSSIFEDVALLSKTTDTRYIMDKMQEISPEEFKSYANILDQNVVIRDDGIVYAIIDAAEEAKQLKNVKHDVLQKMSHIRGTKFYFTVTKNSEDPKWKIKAQLRSVKIPILEKIRELGGGGHDTACGIYDAQNRTAEELKDAIINKLKEIPE